MTNAPQTGVLPFGPDRIPEPDRPGAATFTALRTADVFAALRVGTTIGMTVRLTLPEGIRACLFDLDGVLTQTARIHAAAWQEMFDTYLAERAQRGNKARAFTMPDD